MIWQFWTQHTLGMLHFWEQQFTVVCSIKDAHYLLDVGDAPNGSIWFLWTSWQTGNLDFKFPENWRSTSSICSCNGTSLQSTSKYEGLVLWNINHYWLFNAKFCFYIYISNIYIIYKAILLIMFYNEPKCILLHTIKWFQLLLCITNNSIKHQSFVNTVKWSNSSILNNSI